MPIVAVKAADHKAHPWGVLYGGVRILLTPPILHVKIANKNGRGKNAEVKMAEDREVLEGKAYAILAYLWILCLVPLILKKENKFALFHAKQGLILFIGELVVGFVGIIPFIGWMILFLGTFLFGILSLAGIVQALMGNYWKMPVVGDVAEKVTF
jgi:uncharacterized membrane protein